MSQPELVELKEQVYKDPRPAEHFARFHERTRTHRPNFVYELVRITDEPDRVGLLPRGQPQPGARARRSAR